MIDLETAIGSQDDARIAEAVRGVDPSTADAAVRRKLARLARETRSAQVRNAAVLVLADIGHADAGQVVLSLLRAPHTAGTRRTLLFALQELGVSLPLGDLVALLQDECFETREDCLLALAEGRYEASPAERLKVVQELAAQAEAAGTEPERREAIESALSLLRGAAETSLPLTAR